MEKKILFHKIGYYSIIGSLIGFVLFILFGAAFVLGIIFVSGLLSWSYSRYLYSKEKQ